MTSLRIRTTILLLFVSLVARGDIASLGYTEIHAQTAKEIVEKLSERHYRKQPLDDALSQRLFENYIDGLDPLKSYFFESDLVEFKAYERSLDDSLLAADLEPGFYIYNRFRERMKGRLVENIQLLESGAKFDYTIDEALATDGDERHWFTSENDADDYWRKRVKDAQLRLILSGKEPDAARELLIKRYSNQLAQLSQQDSDDAFQFFINALTEVYDPHTSYLSPRTLDNFNIAMSLSLEGIGAVLQREDEFTKVVRVVPAGPADKEGTLKAGDKIVGVAQGRAEEITDVIGWRLDDVVDLIRGKKDTIVRLEVLPSASEISGQTTIISITREKVRLEEQAAKKEVLELEVGEDNYRVGVINIPAFYMDFEAFRNRDPNFKSTTRDVQKLLIELQTDGVDGIVIDLRNNGGGSLMEATALTDLFINPGPVVQIRHSSKRISREQRSRRKAFYDGPLLVLINRLSASASEIFAGAIQDYRRALVVGSPSFGKGTVQVLAPLNQGQLKFTESKFYRVSGDSTQHRGVIPDIIFPSYYDNDQIGESSQEYALPWDSIHAVKHAYYQPLGKWLPALKERHAQRVAKSPDWQYMLDEIAFINEQRDIKSITLHQEKRKALQQARENHLLGLENKRRRALKLPELASYQEIQAEKEGSEEKAGEDDNAKDPLLREAGHLLMDYLHLNSSASMPKLVGTEAKPSPK
ncbi:MAG TPA: tail-specific protease [Porticoccaceae bacterium]|nr:tail-specific protease [Porticoccaceae bacterium]